MAVVLAGIGSNRRDSFTRRFVELCSLHFVQVPLACSLVFPVSCGPWWRGMRVTGWSEGVPCVKSGWCLMLGRN